MPNKVAFRMFYDNIMTVQWIRRAWVFQGIALAPRSAFIMPGFVNPSGSYGTICLEELFFLSESFSKINPRVIDDAKPVIGEMYRHWIARHLPDSPQIAPLERTLLSLSPGAKTSEHLDTLFAFYGLNGDPSIHLQPFYDLGMPQNLVQCVNSIINGTRRLDILEVICMSKKVRKNLPSWVPDFCQPPSRMPLVRPTTHYHQGNDSQLLYTWQGSCDLTTLRAHGEIIDTVDCHLDPMTPPSLFEYPTEQCIAGIYKRFSDRCAGLYGTSEQRNPRDTSQRILQAIFLGGYCQPEDVDDLEFEEITRMLDSCSISLSETDEEHVLLATIECNDYRMPYKTLEQTKDRLLSCLAQTRNGRDIWVTRLSRLAAIPQFDKMKPEIVICILHGSRYPIAMGRRVPGNTYEALGACYLEGWMDAWGSGKVDWKEKDAQEFEIT
jgi:hypothetical protein